MEQDNDLAPWHYADALVRADLGISGFGLEINAGYWPRGSAHRPAFEYGRLIDQWSQLGLPLMVMLTAPSSGEPDPLAMQTIRPEPIETAAGASRRSASCVGAACGAAVGVAAFACRCVLWNQLADAEPHEFPQRRAVRRQGQGEADAGGASRAAQVERV